MGSGGETLVPRRYAFSSGQGLWKGQDNEKVSSYAFPPIFRVSAEKWFSLWADFHYRVIFTYVSKIKAVYTVNQKDLF